MLGPSRCPRAHRGLVMDVAEGVGVHEAGRGGEPVVVDAAEVHRARVDDPDAQPPGRGERRHVRVRALDAGPEVGRGVDQRVGALVEHRRPTLEVAGGRLLARARRRRRSGCARSPAPAARHASASAAISSGCRGMFGLRSFVVVPLIAASMMTGSAMSSPRPRRLAPVCRTRLERCRMHIDLTRRAAGAPARAPRVLRRADDARAARRAHGRRGRRRGATARSSARWAATAGSGSGGRRSTAVRAAPRSSSTSSSTRRTGPASRCRSSRSTPSGRRCGCSAPTSRSASSCPKILAGEMHFAIGYTEPGAGTDLASLRTRAVRDGDEYVINGQKVFTTGGHDADCIWLACRTDPDAPKHKGISIILVPTDVAGLQAHADLDARRRAHERHVLRGRARAGRRTSSARRTRAGS